MRERACARGERRDAAAIINKRVGPTTHRLPDRFPSIRIIIVTPWRSIRRVPRLYPHKHRDLLPLLPVVFSCPRYRRCRRCRCPVLAVTVSVSITLSPSASATLSISATIAITAAYPREINLLKHLQILLRDVPDPIPEPSELHLLLRDRALTRLTNQPILVPRRMTVRPHVPERIHRLPQGRLCAGRRPTAGHGVQRLDHQRTEHRTQQQRLQPRVRRRCCIPLLGARKQHSATHHVEGRSWIPAQTWLTTAND